MKSFKEYLGEASVAGTAQQGFAYENNAAKALKPLGIVPKDFKPAGAGHDVPDLIIQRNGVKAGLELKITAASAGSLVMKYENGNWSIGSPTETNDEKLFIIQLAKEVGVLKLIQQKWKKEPYKFAKTTRIKNEKQKIMDESGKRAVYDAELLRFPELKGEIPATKISEYYNKKKTYYVNIGTHGFYLLGSRNPLKLKGIPKFGSSAKAVWRARVQAKGGGAYQFTFEMNFSIPAGGKSPYNIAPITKGSVVIDKSKLNVEWFLESYKGDLR